MTKVVSLAMIFVATTALTVSADAGADVGNNGPKLNFVYAKGSADGGSPTFDAVAWTGPDTESGLVAIIDGKPECEGDFTYADETSGKGWFSCQDGSKGSFRFSMNEDGSGSGRGEYQDQLFSFDLADAPFAADD